MRVDQYKKLDSYITLFQFLIILLLAHCGSGNIQLKVNQPSQGQQGDAGEFAPDFETVVAWLKGNEENYKRVAKSLVNTFPFKSNEGAEEDHEHQEDNLPPPCCASPGY